MLSFSFCFSFLFLPLPPWLLQTVCGPWTEHEPLPALQTCPRHSAAQISVGGCSPSEGLWRKGSPQEGRKREQDKSGAILKRRMKAVSLCWAEKSLKVISQHNSASQDLESLHFPSPHSPPETSSVSLLGCVFHATSIT